MALETIAGITNVTVSSPRTGAVVLSVVSCSVRLSGNTTETKSGASGTHGRKKMPMPGRIVVECHTSPTFEIADCREWDDDASVQAVAATGTLYTLIGGRVGDMPELDTVEGTFTLEFEGECEETVS